MSAEDNTAPVVADRRTGAVVAELDDAQPIAHSARWVASLLWVILVVTCAAVTIGSAAALILDFLAPAPVQSGAKETVLLLFTTSFNSLIALFVSRPGTR